MNRKITIFPYRMRRRSVIAFHEVLEFLDLDFSNGKFQWFEKCHDLRYLRFSFKYSKHVSLRFGALEKQICETCSLRLKALKMRKKVYFI